MAKKNGATAIGDTVAVRIGADGKGPERPVIVTSVNADGTVNGNVQLEPGDNPTNDGNVQRFYQNLKVQ